MKKFTIMYLDSWMSGSRHHSLTKMVRPEAESPKDIMESEYGDKIIYLFEGHPLMVGESSVETPIEYFSPKSV